MQWLFQRGPTALPLHRMIKDSYEQFAEKGVMRLVSRSPFGSIPGRGIRKIVMFNPEVEALKCCRSLISGRGRVIKHLPFINAAVVEFMPSLPEAVWDEMAAHPDVLTIEDDFEVHTTCWLGSSAPVNQPHQSVPWGVEKIKAPLAWADSQGEGVRVATLDTGVDFGHPDLRPNLRRGYNVLAPGTLPRDRNGHGTHTAGTIVAANNSIGVVGVAPKATLYPVKVLDSRGMGRISTIVSGLEWATKNQMQLVNMSLGSSNASKALETAVKNAVAKGVIIVASAGNVGKPDSVLYPARYPEVVAVSAINEQGQRADFSSYGPEVTVCAPGVEVLSTYPGGRYKKMNGTSMAAPHVTGALALLLGKISTVNASEIMRRLRRGVQHLPGLSREEQGFGLIDAQALVQGGAAWASEGEEVEQPVLAEAE
ncbi:MAG: S8 family peptidase [Clostridia bacterium]|nr:S8 family peptidase [Clostridia bacterium]